jgi:hypothetical protein
VTTIEQVGPLRLVAQRVAGPGFGTAAEAVRWMTAMQAQDPRGAAESVLLRAAGGDVAAAFTAGEIVKSWPMRGTLHLTAAEDLQWILGLTSARTLTAAASRRAGLGLDDAIIGQARDLLIEALTGGRSLPRAGLMALWDSGGVSTAGQRGYHLLWHCALTALVCFGPVRDGEQHLVLADEWITAPRRPGREEALGELALRYFRSHGPATARDFARWTGLLAADCRTGIAAARPSLAAVHVDGVEHLMDPATPDLLAAHREDAHGVHLLPGFDEFILGYGERGAVLDPEFAPLIVPGNNGMFRPTVIDRGRVAGVWKRGRDGAVDATPFTAFPARVTKALAAH